MGDLFDPADSDLIDQLFPDKLFPELADPNQNARIQILEKKVEALENLLYAKKRKTPIPKKDKCK